MYKRTGARIKPTQSQQGFVLVLALLLISSLASLSLLPPKEAEPKPVWLRVR
jgi:hypothetical protein